MTATENKSYLFSLSHSAILWRLLLVSEIFSKLSTKCFYYSLRQKHGFLNSLEKIKQLYFLFLTAILILF